MPREERSPLVDDILGKRRATMGADFDGSRNHIYGMLDFCFALHDCREAERTGWRTTSAAGAGAEVVAATTGHRPTGRPSAWQRPRRRPE